MQRNQQQLLQMSAVEDGVDTSTSSPNSNERTGRSQVEINTELQSGRTLEGGATMDFAGVKDTTSRSERALSVARDDFLAGGSATALYGRDEDGVRLIGINDEVVQEVGREVGTFITTYDRGTVQGCAEWLRSRAAPGLFETKEPAGSVNGGTGDAYAAAYAAATSSASSTSTTSSPSPEQIETYRKLLDEAAIGANIAGIESVFSKFLSFGSGDRGSVMVNNADWLEELNYIDFLRNYGRHFSVSRMLTYDSVKLRLDREQPLSFIEFNYQVLQAYDFVELFRRQGCRLQMGGSDQWGNIVGGIELGRRTASAELFGLTTPLLTTSSGAKANSSAS